MDSQEKVYRDHSPVKCPVPSCTEVTCASYFDLKIHFFDVHDLKMRVSLEVVGCHSTKISRDFYRNKIQSKMRVRTQFWAKRQLNQRMCVKMIWMMMRQIGRDEDLEDTRKCVLSARRAQTKRKMLLTDSDLCKRKRV